MPPVPEIKAVVDDLKQGIEAQYGNVFRSVDGFALCDLEGLSDPDNSKKDSPMGNLITDSYRYKTHTKIGITAQGLIAEKIYRGAVTSADLFRTVSDGFDTTNGLDFRLATFDISGAELIKGLEIGLSLIGVDDDFFLQVSGMKFKYNPENDPGERVILSSVKIGNRHISPTGMYSVTVNEGLLGILLSLGGVVVENIQILPDNEYTVLKNFVRHKRILYYKPEGRIKEVGSGDEIVSDNDVDISEDNYILFDNYPNPFNPSTTINYHLPVSGVVSMKIYDMVGKEVVSLVNENQEAGNYSVKWDATAFSSGVYFYKIQSGDFVQTKRMILMK